MEHSPFSDPPLTVALALVIGILAQAVAWHLRIPGIVLLLGAGLVLGPDGIDIVRPGILGGGLQMLVGYAVAIILFEGALSLNLRRLARQGTTIRRLVTVGAVITTLGGAASTRWILGWDWNQSLLFGTLVIVTGPTVIQPLLRRIRVKRNLATVLGAEGVFGDAVGAIVAVVALEIALRPSPGSVASGFLDLLSRFGFGGLLGLAGGLVIAAFLRREHLVPEGLENVFALTLVLATYQISNSLVHESGVVAVTIAGLTVGNIPTRALEDLREFKEQLTVLFIGMLFVLLAADVRLEEVRALGLPGLAVVGVLMVLVRPLNVLACTAGERFDAREKLFLSWIAPRGIVAAAVSSLFALRLEAENTTGGTELRALVFLVIAVTVVVQGVTGGFLARLLGLRRAKEGGYVFLGANAVARTLARLLEEADQPVLLVDSSPDACSAAEEMGLRVIYGSALAESVLLRAGLEERDGCVAMTENESVNFGFARRARNEFKVRRAWVAVREGRDRVTASMVERAEMRLLFGAEVRLDTWAYHLERGRARLESWRGEEDAAELTGEMLHEELASVLPLMVRRGRKHVLMDETVTAGPEDEILLLVLGEKDEESHGWLEEHGWGRSPSPPDESLGSQPR